MVLGKMPPGNIPPGKCLPENWPLKKCPSKNCPPEHCPSENCTPWMFFINFFLSLVFIFMRIFVHKKNLFSIRKIYFHSIKFFIINLFILYLCIIFSYAYIFDSQVWHIMFIIHICVTNNAGASSLPGYTLFL